MQIGETPAPPPKFPETGENRKVFEEVKEMARERSEQRRQEISDDIARQMANLKELQRRRLERQERVRQQQQRIQEIEANERSEMPGIDVVALIRDEKGNVFALLCMVGMLIVLVKMLQQRTAFESELDRLEDENRLLEQQNMALLQVRRIFRPHWFTRL